MVQTAYRESHYVPNAVNYDCWPNHINPATSLPYICAGLLQVMEIHTSNWLVLLDPETNIDIAYSVWLKDKFAWGN